MSIKTENLVTNRLTSQPESTIIKNTVLPGEVKDVLIEFFSVKGPYQYNKSSKTDRYDVLISLKGNATLNTIETEYNLSSDFIVRIPYSKDYFIQVGKGKEFHFLRISKFLDKKDRFIIGQKIEEHLSVFIKPLSECPTYSENIKSDKAINRMIIPEGSVPRFCMGSVETDGPDSVDSHEHPMLDQLFLGLKNCNCTCYANKEQVFLMENLILHVPLGSMHSISVTDGDKLFYIWLDFFLTIEGQKYMADQHQMDNE